MTTVNPQDEAPLFAVLMAGGSGIRFWPVSRAKRPKQLVHLTGERTLIQQTYDRIVGLTGPGRVLVVTGRDHAREVRIQLSDLEARNVLVEPLGRNTAPCAALAALAAWVRNPKAIVALFPADHVVKDEPHWRTLVVRAAQAVRAHPDRIITFGLKPTRLETGFGYIETGDPVGEAILPGGMTVRRFVEKPDVATVAAFLEGGRHLWNGGVFVVGARHLLDCVAHHLPLLWAGLMNMLLGSPEPVADPGHVTPTQMNTLSNALSRPASLRADDYARLPSISLDHGIMEKESSLWVLPADVGWSDVGSWSALDEVLVGDSGGNVTVGSATMVDSHNCVAYGDGARVVLLGVRDLIVVQTRDAVLVCPRGRAQDVRRVVQRLQEDGLDDLL